MGNALRLPTHPPAAQNLGGILEYNLQYKTPMHLLRMSVSIGTNQQLTDRKCSVEKMHQPNL
jgi:hypothetical protein